MPFSSRYYARLFQSFMNHSPALWWLKDAAGKYVFANDTFANFWQLQPDMIAGKTDLDIMPRESAEGVRLNDRFVLETQKEIHVHETLKTPHGERIFLTIKFPFIDTGNRFVGGIAFDVTSQRRSEIDLETARDQALEAAALKQSFVASIQHEIRTPLAGIIGLTELVLLSSGLTDEQKYLCSMVHQSSEALLGVLNDVLDMSKLESGSLIVREIPFNIPFVVRESVRLMSATARLKGLELTVEIDENIPERVSGDPERLRQILLNLVSNAVKFTEVGKISVEARLLKTNKPDATVRFLVSDTGIGIDDEHKASLFIPFWQGDMSTTRKFGGPGLGLSISKLLVEKMGGSGIELESEPDVGSRFWFDLTFGPVSTAASSTIMSDVLIIEDNVMLQSLLIRQFENLGISAYSAPDFSAAVPLVEAAAHRLILCEQITRDGDACEFVRMLRHQERINGWVRTPVVIMAGELSKSERERCIQAGADDYVTKPLSTEQLWLLINRWGLNKSD